MAISSRTESRFLYLEVAPENITVPVAELLGKLPEQYRGSGACAAGRRVDIPCGELLGGNTPRMTVGRLHELLPDLVVIPEGGDRASRLQLPAGWLALHFGLVTRKEEIPPSEEKEGAGVVPGGTREPDAMVKEAGNSTPFVAATMADAGKVSEKDQPVTGQFPTPEAANAPDKQEVKDSGFAQADPVPLPVLPSGDLLPKASQGPEAARRRSIFDSLPMFRRHRPSEEPAPVKESSADSPPPEVAPDSEIPAADVVVMPAGMPEAVKIKEPVKPSTVLTEVTVERLWKFDPSDQIADAAALQSLFMTEEKLTLDRVMGMAGGLPGLRACVLAHGEQVICAPSSSPGIDLRNLSTQAVTMLTQIRETSSRMGLGSVPAVTLHADQGTLSFLHNGELCLLVLHADRGFVPGVRERLQEMLGHLVDARPALPGKNHDAGEGLRSKNGVN